MGGLDEAVGGCLVDTAELDVERGGQAEPTIVGPMDADLSDYGRVSEIDLLSGRPPVGAGNLVTAVDWGFLLDQGEASLASGCVVAVRSVTLSTRVTTIRLPSALTKNVDRVR